MGEGKEEMEEMIMRGRMEERREGGARKNE
jgi:hypothetical protein